MQYNNLGKTGLKVSRLCLGMMTYGAKTWRDWVLTEEEAKPFVKRALDAGINFFDTADVYSLGESERITGNLMRHFGVKRENVSPSLSHCRFICALADGTTYTRRRARASSTIHAMDWRSLVVRIASW